jgi:uncharacterized RDD family membrane protein YckC
MSMGPVAEPAPPGARCAKHPSVAATATCPRCGNFACHACLRPVDDRLCCASCAGASAPLLGSHSARLAANMLDSIITMLPVTIAVTCFAVLFAETFARHVDSFDFRDLPVLDAELAQTLLAVASGSSLLAIAVIACNVYFVAQNGQSIGKRLLGLRVLRRDGSPASWQRVVFLRNVLPGALGGVPFVGSVFSMVDGLFIFRADRRCLHDHIADTIVVQVPKQK